MGSVREADSSFSLPLAYSMYYIWKTVILKGDYIYEFAVYPFEGKHTDSELHKKALEYNFPCITSVSATSKGGKYEQIQPLTISSTDIVLSALYTRDGTPYLRFYESRGKKGNLNINYAGGLSSFTEVNLEGKELGKTDSPLSFGPWQIRTLKLVIPGR
jgi:alpha-mannosidase